MSALAAFRTSILLLLSDASNAIFSANMVDQALRWALTEYSYHRPLLRTYDFTVDVSTKIHTLPADFVTRHISKVELWDATPDNMVEIPHYAWIRDEQWQIMTNYAIGAGEVLEITYSAIHTIDGLDSAAGTTVPEADEPILHIGAAGRAAQMRAVDTVESINMNPEVIRDYRLLASDFLARFAAMCNLDPGIYIGLPEYPTQGGF